MTFSLTLANNGVLWTPKVSVVVLPQPCNHSDVISDLVEFISENEGLFAAYRVDEAKDISSPLNIAISSRNQHNPGMMTPT